MAEKETIHKPKDLVESVTEELQKIILPTEKPEERKALCYITKYKECSF